MKLTNKSSKIVGYIIGIIIFVGLLIGVTYAIYNWRSVNTNISVNTKCFDAEGDSSLTVQGSNMLFFNESDILDTINSTITYKTGMLYAPFKIISSNCTTDTYYDIVLNVTSLPSDYVGTIKYKIIEDMGANYTQVEYSNPLNETLEYNPLYSGSITGTGSSIIYSENILINTTSVPAVIFYIDGDLVPENASSLVFNATVEVIARQGNISGYVGYLYNKSQKIQATVNNITYYLAPSVGLMNDRHASSSVDFYKGDLRYYGANPNNYVWLGDNFVSDYTYTSNGESITRTAGSKKLWRIIGVFDGRLKLISADPISTTKLSWDTTSSSAANANKGYGINQWGPSTYSNNGNSYEGADLMRLLNEGYTGINGSLYWNKGTGTVYTNNNNATTSNVSFANTGLSDYEKSLIDTANWYLGATSEILGNGYHYADVYVDEQYVTERQNIILGNSCTNSRFNLCNDLVVRTDVWTGKVGLMYPSDYGYAADLSICGDNKLAYNATCRATDWLQDSSNIQWSITPFVISDESRDVVTINTSGVLSYNISAYVDMVRSAVYLKSNVNFVSGTGTENDPYILGLD